MFDFLKDLPRRGLAVVLLAMTYPAFVSAAKAADSKVALDCMAQSGFTAAEWHAHTVSRKNAAFYKACMTQHGKDVTVTRNGQKIF